VRADFLHQVVAIGRAAAVETRHLEDDPAMFVQQRLEALLKLGCHGRLRSPPCT
jgi:hypothetical protein